MINIIEKGNCCGCSACESICPNQSITMTADEEGFFYPKVNHQSCVNCNLCNQVCPLENKGAKNTIIKTYAAKHRDVDVLKQSTSGGIFTALSDNVLSVGGCVYGASFDDSMVVKHQRAINAEERDTMRGSKYVQSDTRSVFSMVKKDLEEGKFVLFTGTPCQIDGLNHYLKGKTEGLLCCDLICHGVSSPLILKEHFKFISGRNRKKLTNYFFRPKRWGWHVHREIALFEGGKEYHSCAYSDLWRSIYYGRLATRPSCHSCQYSNLLRPGDITIGDCRGIDKLAPEFGSYDGVSLVLVNTQKGKEAFDDIRKQLIVREINIDDVMQPPLQEPSEPSGNRELFWNTYLEKGYKKAIDACFGHSYRLKYQVKKLLHKD